MKLLQKNRQVVSLVNVDNDKDNTVPAIIYAILYYEKLQLELLKVNSLLGYLRPFLKCLPQLKHFRKTGLPP